jgi:hypothetical protein
MIKERIIQCKGCGLKIDQAGQDCPLCHYPLDPIKEERFLVAAISDLQRVATYGGARLRVIDLLSLYRSRLDALHQPQAIAVPVPATPPVAAVSLLAVTPAPAQVEAPRKVEVAVPVTRVSPPPPRRVFSWKSFFADQAINIVASLGAFLILVGALGFTSTTSNLLLAFVIVFAVHAVFGITGFVTYRFASFRVVATIYTIIYALLVPLVGFAAYRLIVGNHIALSVPVLVAIAATYAAIVYTLLAIYQRFQLFAYLGIAALAVADMAVARALSLGYWWWPSMLMILALLSLVSIQQSADRQWLFAGSRAVLREPVRIFLYVFASVCALGVLAIAGYSFMLDASSMQNAEVRFSILCLTLLVLLWSGLFLWLTRRTRFVIGLAFLFLASVLALCYALAFDAIGYALALTAVALLYHGFSRFAPRLLQPFGALERALDWIALALVFLVPWISSPSVPLQLIANAYAWTWWGTYQTGWRTIAELVALAAGLVLTLSVTFKRASLQRTPARPAWRWMLLLGVFLLDFGYSLVIVSLNLTPVWYMLGLTLAMMAGAVIVRQMAGAAWANPLDIGVLVNIAITLGLSGNQGQDSISVLLLFFAVATYGILLYQRRQNWLVVPLAFALMAVPTLESRPEVMLVASVMLPLAAIAIHRLVSEKWTEAHAKWLSAARLAGVWEWPLLAAGLVYGVTIAANDVMSSTSTIQHWLGAPCPVALELALLSLVWYGSAALARVKVWLLPAAGFAIVAALLPYNAFWVLVGLAPALAILAVITSRLAGRDWALPLYITALLCGVMAGYTGFTQDQLGAAAWALLAFAALAYGIGAVEDQVVPMWVAPFFASWSMVVSAGFLNDLYQPPVVAIAAAALGAGVSYFKLIPVAHIGAGRKRNFITYSLPLYTTALIGALLTGVSGSLSDINRPFYGAVPDALLIYGVVAFAVLLYERRPGWLWLAAGLAAWGTALAAQLTPMYVPLIGAGAAVAGVLVGRIIKPATVPVPLQIQSLRQFTWSWPAYLLVLLAAILTGARTALPVEQASGNFIAYSLLAFSAVALGIMLVERLPELLVFPVGLAAWTIWLWYPPLDIAPLMMAYSGLCVLAFVSQIIWRVIPPVNHLLPVGSLHDLLGLGGQSIVVLAIALQGGLFADAGMLVHVGAASLFVLAALLFAYGWMRTHNVTPVIPVERDDKGAAARLQRAKVIQRWCYYSAGLLLSLVVSWELSAFRQTRLDVLLLAPASYLSVAAPFLMRDKLLPAHSKVGQVAAALGAALLLLPSLWFSFSESNLLPTLILVGEALVLLALGIVTRVRIFVLSSAALVVVGALRALFLSTPPSLALMLLGGILLAIATALILARRQLRAAWSRWE